MRFVPLILFIMLSACGERELIAGLDERQSIEAVLALHRAGVSSARESDTASRGRSYRLIVPSEAYAKGLEVVGGYGFPRKTDDEFNEAVKNSSLLPPSKDLSQIKVDRAIAMQVERLLQGLPGVVDVRVVVRGGAAESQNNSYMPSRSGITNKAHDRDVRETSAVVVLRNLNGSSIDLAQVKDLVKRTVSGLETDSIEVQVLPVALPSADLPVGVDERGSVIALVKLNLFSFRVPEEDLGLARGVITTVVFVFGLCTFVVGLLVGSNYLSKPRYLRSDRVGGNVPMQDSSLALAQKAALLRRGIED